jgi:hypothetical protein
LLIARILQPKAAKYSVRYGIELSVEFLDVDSAREALMTAATFSPLIDPTSSLPTQRPGAS